MILSARRWSCGRSIPTSSTPRRIRYASERTSGSGRSGDGSARGTVSSGKPRPSARMATALADLGRAMEDLPQPGVIVGGIAAIAHGVPRVTRDIDVAIDVQIVDIDRAADTLERHDFAARIPDARAFARDSGVLLMRHRRSGVEI